MFNDEEIIGLANTIDKAIEDYFAKQKEHQKNLVKEEYEVQIIKMVNGEKVESLLGYVNSLDELVANIDKFVERMRPLPYDPEIEKSVNKVFENLKK